MDQRDDMSRADDGSDPVTRSTSQNVGDDRRPLATGLTAAMRRARTESAERMDVVIDLRGAELTRLEMLRDHLAPVFAEVPPDCDTFDPGLVPGARPRLFVDAVAFIEMGRDRRSYRFVQDTRTGRVVLCESERIETTVRAVTEYVARRLVEREKALASYASATAAYPLRETQQREVATPRTRPRVLRVAARTFLFLVEIIGSAVVFAALAAGAFWAWQTAFK